MAIIEELFSGAKGFIIMIVIMAIVLFIAILIIEESGFYTELLKGQQQEKLITLTSPSGNLTPIIACRIVSANPPSYTYKWYVALTDVVLTYAEKSEESVVAVINFKDKVVIGTVENPTRNIINFTKQELSKKTNLVYSFTLSSAGSSSQVVQMSFWKAGCIKEVCSNNGNLQAECPLTYSQLIQKCARSFLPQSVSLVGPGEVTCPSCSSYNDEHSCSLQTGNAKCYWDSGQCKECPPDGTRCDKIGFFDCEECAGTRCKQTTLFGHAICAPKSS